MTSKWLTDSQTESWHQVTTKTRIKKFKNDTHKNGAIKKIMTFRLACAKLEAKHLKYFWQFCIKVFLKSPRVFEWCLTKLTEI